jgi:hypothetical protein
MVRPSDLAEDSVKLTDTQRRLLAAASRRDDRALERPSHLTGGAAGKMVAKLVTEGANAVEPNHDRRTAQVPARLPLTINFKIPADWTPEQALAVISSSRNDRVARMFSRIARS